MNQLLYLFPSFIMSRLIVFSLYLTLADWSKQGVKSGKEIKQLIRRSRSIPFSVNYLICV